MPSDDIVTDAQPQADTLPTGLVVKNGQDPGDVLRRYAAAVSVMSTAYKFSFSTS